MPLVLLFDAVSAAQLSLEALDTARNYADADLHLLKLPETAMERAGTAICSQAGYAAGTVGHAALAGT